MELQWPLILFTTLLAWSAGLLATQSVFVLKGSASETKVQMPALITSFALMVVGGVAVFFHLQHWERIFNGFGHITSGITQELIAIVVMFVVMLIFFISLRREEKIPTWAAVAAIVVALALIFVMGHSYLMASRPTWNSVLQIASLLGAAIALGAGTFALIEGVRTEDVSPITAKIAIVGSAIGALTTVAYVIAMSAATGQFRDYGFVYDPTHPAIEPATATQYSAVSGDALFVSVTAIVCAILALVFAVLGKHDGKWKIWGSAIIASSAIAAICLRVVFYMTGGSVYMY